MNNELKVGDRVIFISNNNLQNHGIITWLNTYKFYLNGDLSGFELKTQGKILCDNGTEVYIENMHDGNVELEKTGI